MKKFFFTMLLAASPICMMGQTRVIKGYVVDKKTGNYLPGAEVTATGGAESTTTDADGSFSLEVGRYVKSATARYAGMVDKKLRIGEKEELVFRMRKDKGFGFLNFEGGLVLGPKPVSGISNAYNQTEGVIGLMGGYLDKWGVYGKFTINPWGNDVLLMGSFGVTKRILPWLHASLGLGVGLGAQYSANFSSYSTYYVYPFNPENNYYSNGGYVYGYSDSKIQVMPEIGVFFKISKHLLANLHYGIGICAKTSDPYDYTTAPVSDSSYTYSYINSIAYSQSYWKYKSTTGLNHNLSIGIGYIF